MNGALSLPPNLSAEAVRQLRNVVQNEPLRRAILGLVGAMEDDERNSRFRGAYTIDRQGRQLSIHHEIVESSQTVPNIILFPDTPGSPAPSE